MASDSIREHGGRADGQDTQSVRPRSGHPWSRTTDESEKAMVYIERNKTADVLTCCYAAL